MSATAAQRMHRFRSPKTVIGRFVAKRTMRSAAIWAVAFGLIVASKAAGYAAAYPTLAARTKLATSFSNNVGLEALFGVPHHIQTVSGFAVWNTLGVIALIGSVWAFLLATKTFRGEEDAGRLELLLTGQTTAARAAANMLTGIGVSLVVLYIIAASIFIAVGSLHTVHFGVSAALFFGLAVVSGATMFMSIGALTSQLMPTRSRAASLAALIFGVSFLLRAMADTSTAHWVLNLTPLGWIERLQPLNGSHSIWLLPIFGLALICCTATVILAARRDLGASTFADKDSAAPHVRLLSKPLPLAVRLTRRSSISWVIAIGLVATFFGLLTNSAAQAFSDAGGARHVLRNIAHAAQQTGAKTFLGIVFFILMTLTMVYVANAIGAVREEEAAGYLDNLLVRPVNRVKWLIGRITILIGIVVLIAAVTTLGAWAGTASQHTNVPYHTLLMAGSNLLAPAVLIAGIGIAALGIIPRLTTLIAYTVIAWSFLIQILSSGLNLSHWVLDTSIFQHVALAPAVNPDWSSAAALVGIGILLSLIGITAFNRRDLAAE